MMTTAVRQLVDSGLLAESDLERARVAAEAMATPVHSALVRLGLVAEDAMARTGEKVLRRPARLRRPVHELAMGDLRRRLRKGMPLV